MKPYGRVYLIRPSARPFTFALPVRLTAKAVPAIMNGEKNQMDNARKQKRGS
jgi:hypothetical protein